MAYDDDNGGDSILGLASHERVPYSLSQLLSWLAICTFYVARQHL